MLKLMSQYALAGLLGVLNRSGLGNVLPTLSPDNAPRLRQRNTVCPGKADDRLPHCMPPPHLCNVFSKHAGRYSLTPLPMVVPVDPAPSIMNVGNVLSLGSGVQMVRTNAGKNVAVVQDGCALWNRATIQCVRDPMGSKRLRLTPGPIPNLAVTGVGIDRPRPYPAAPHLWPVRRNRAILVDMHPEQHSEGGRSIQATASHSTEFSAPIPSPMPGDKVLSETLNTSAQDWCTILMHRTYLRCQTPGVRARRGHFMPLFYQILYLVEGGNRQ